jgi:hypothetical protein
MKPLALPLLVVTLASLGGSARATEPDLTLPVVVHTGLLSLGSRDSLLLLANERQLGITYLTVEFFDADDDLVATKLAEVKGRQTATIPFSYAELGAAAPLAAVRLRVTVVQEKIPAGEPQAGLPLPSRLTLTLEHASQPSAALASAEVEGLCAFMAGPPLSGGGPDSKCSGALVVQDEFEGRPLN